jgi:hypothetical protein
MHVDYTLTPNNVQLKCFQKRGNSPKSQRSNENRSQQVPEDLANLGAAKLLFFLENDAQ